MPQTDLQKDEPKMKSKTIMMNKYGLNVDATYTE